MHNNIDILFVLVFVLMEIKLETYVASTPTNLNDKI